MGMFYVLCIVDSLATKTGDTDIDDEKSVTQSDVGNSTIDENADAQKQGGRRSLFGRDKNQGYVTFQGNLAVQPEESTSASNDAL